MADENSGSTLLDAVLSVGKASFVIKKYKPSMVVEHGTYGTLVFATVGILSVLLRFCSLLNLTLIILFLILFSFFLIWLLDRRIFWFRIFISYESLVPAILIISLFSTLIFMVLYLAGESITEGKESILLITDWIQTQFIDDESTQSMLTYQIEYGKSAVSSALQQLDLQYNQTVWWPTVKELYKFYNTQTSNTNTNLPSNIRNMTVSQSLSLAYDKYNEFNFSTDAVIEWTTQGFGIGSIAFTSLINIAIYFGALFIAFISLGIHAIFFVSLLFFLLSNQVGII